MSKLPSVAMVTPTYNQAQYLSASIESVLAQDYPELQYIVVNDGSTDETEAVIDRYRDKIDARSHANIGQSATLNAAWHSADAEFIGYLSSDDLLRPHAVSGLVKAMQASPDAIVAYCDFDQITGDDSFIRARHTEAYNKGRLTEDLICLPGPGALFRRSAFLQIGGWQESLRQVPDFDFWLKMSEIGIFVHVPEVLATQRIHNSNASFRPINVQRATEIVRVTEAYWADKDARKRKRALARAQLLCAALHFQSRRYVSGIAAYMKSIAANPTVAFHYRGIRLVVGGVVRGVRGRFIRQD